MSPTRTSIDVAPDPARLTVPGSRLAVLGAGRSGLAAARLAARLGAGRILLADAALPGRKADHPAIVPRFELGPTGTLTSAELDQLDAVIISPGVRPDLPLVTSAAERGLPILSELEFSWQQTDRPTIAVTGTNGKTTTTELVARLVNAAGTSCRPAGNHGLPLAELLLDELDRNGPGDQVHVLEVSSFQLEAIHNFRPDVALWLNFAPDHLDRYPDLGSYHSAKMRIFEFMRPQDRAVVDALQPVIPGSATPVFFSLDPQSATARWVWDPPHLCRDHQPVVELDRTRLRGRPNIANLLAACAAAEAYLGPRAAGGFATAIADYQPPPHRYQWVATIDRRTFINDSKATNLHALEAALGADDNPVVLIAGGKDKQLDFSTLHPLVQARCRAVVAIGECAPQIVLAWRDATRCVTADDMDSAVSAAFSASQPGDIVLLSPGTSSFDMYAGYVQRGESFQSSVHQLQPKSSP